MLAQRSLGLDNVAQVTFFIRDPADLRALLTLGGARPAHISQARLSLSLARPAMLSVAERHWRNPIGERSETVPLQVTPYAFVP